MTERDLDRLPPPPLRVVFMGTPGFAARVLERCLAGRDQVVAVFTRPDAASGRGLRVEPPPVKRLALERGIAVEQPATWKDGAALERLRAHEPDLVIVAAYGRLLPSACLELPRYGCINVHASLLPRWRGADPVSRAILAGDVETGVTIMQMVLAMDAGAILWQRRTPILADDDGATLEARLAELGGLALEEALDAWRAGRLRARDQDESRVTLAPLVHKEDGRIDWTLSAAEIERATRALSPWPGAFTAHGGAALRIWKAAIAEPSSPGSAGASVAGRPALAPGTVVGVDRSGVMVATGAGVLRLLEVQAAGKKRMPAADFARGARVAPGARLGDQPPGGETAGAPGA